MELKMRARNQKQMRKRVKFGENRKLGTRNRHSETKRIKVKKFGVQWHFSAQENFLENIPKIK